MVRGSQCTQTQTCGGLCLTSQIKVPCTVGLATGCPPSSACTPTMSCLSTGSCGGLCIATIPNTTPAPLPTQHCVVGANDCPGGSFCTQTMICGGLCIPTQPPVTQIPCTVGQPGCSTGSTCTPTMTCPATGYCGGACISAASTGLSPTPTSRPCGGKRAPYCGSGFRCVRKLGKSCGPSSYCYGVCEAKVCD